MQGIISLQFLLKPRGSQLRANNCSQDWCPAAGPVTRLVQARPTPPGQMYRARPKSDQGARIPVVPPIQKEWRAVPTSTEVLKPEYELKRVRCPEVGQQPHPPDKVDHGYRTHEPPTNHSTAMTIQGARGEGTSRVEPPCRSAKLPCHECTSYNRVRFVVLQTGCRDGRLDGQRPRQRASMEWARRSALDRQVPEGDGAAPLCTSQVDALGAARLLPSAPTFDLG